MKRRARLSGEKLIMNYLGRVTEAGLSYLPKGSRVAFVGRIKAQIERECGPAGLADAARVMEVLAALGEPEELVRQERAGLDAAWIKSTLGDRNLAQAAAAAINTPRKHRRITSRWKPATDTQSLSRSIDAKSMSAPIGKMNDADDPFATGKQTAAASPEVTSRQPPATGPARQPMGTAGQAIDAGEPGHGPREQPAGADGETPSTAAPGLDPGGQSPNAPASGGGPDAEPHPVGRSPAAPGLNLPEQSPGSDFSPAGQSPGSDPSPAGQGSSPIGSPASPGAAGTALGTSGPGPAKPEGQARTAPSLSVGRLASSVGRFTTDRFIPRVAQLSLTAAVLAREHVREAIAVAVLGIGGLILPDPLWLVGTVVALMSRLWDKRDKWVAFAGPPLVALLGSVVSAAISGGSENAVVVYIDTLKADMGLFLRLGCLLTATYLAWRVYRGPRVKVPPWNRY
ncbi:MAG TPA: hypothetical protein VIV12_29180 [Streptosporangiaceae bacterium]